MQDDTLRRRLEALNRGPIPGRVGEGATANARVAVETPVRHGNGIGAARTTRQSSARAIQPIPGLMRRGEVIETPSGEHLRVCLPLESVWPEGPRLVAARQEHLRQQLALARQAVEPTVVLDCEFAAFIAALPDRTLLLDLETCGLAGAALFLVGLLRQIDGQPIVELLVARSYAEEAAVLESLWERVTHHDVLVTFNGKSFDWPMVLERSVRHRLRPNALETRRVSEGGRVSEEAPRKLDPPLAHASGFQSCVKTGTAPDGNLVHVDVLHHARRRFRRRLPDCRLQTLERYVCRRERGDDIPGHLIPGVYAEYVRTGFEREMDLVLYHNAIDLVTLLDLAMRLAG